MVCSDDKFRPQQVMSLFFNSSSDSINFLIYVDAFCICEQSFLLENAIGWRSCSRTAPMPWPEVSACSTKGSEK